MSYLIGGIGLIYDGFMPGDSVSNKYGDGTRANRKSNPEPLGDERLRGEK